MVKTVAYATIKRKMGRKVMAVKFSERDFQLLHTIGQVEKYPPYTNIYTQGDDAALMYIIVKGRVRALYLSAEGKERTIEVLEKGRIFGDASFLNKSRRSVTVRTVVETEIIRCKPEDLIDICINNVNILRIVFQHMTETCDYLTHQIVRNNFYTSEQKVMDFLLSEADNRGVLCLPYTHEEIADSVGLNRVTVSRILSKLGKSRLIDLQYGKILICDKSKMEQMNGGLK